MAHSITFPVHDVAPARAPFPGADLRTLFAPFCSDPKAPLKLLSVEAETKNSLVFTHDVEELGFSNGLAAACVFAWNGHYNLEVSPDIVWIAIAQASLEARTSFDVLSSENTEIILKLVVYMNRRFHEQRSVKLNKAAS